MAKALAKIAAESGKDASEKDFAEALEELEETVRQRTDAAASDVRELEDDELEKVAGGRKNKDGCFGDFVDTDCIIHDACDNWWAYYYNCTGKHSTRYVREDSTTFLEG